MRAERHLARRASRATRPTRRARSTASTGIVEGVRKGIRVDGDEIELHLALRWGVSIPEVGAAVQRRVADYLERMTDARPAAVNVVVDEIDEPS